MISHEVFRIALAQEASTLSDAEFTKRIQITKQKIRTLLAPLNLGRRLSFAIKYDDGYGWLLVSIKTSGQCGLLEEVSANLHIDPELERERSTAVEQVRTSIDILNDLIDASPMKAMQLDQSWRRFSSVMGNTRVLPLLAGTKGLPQSVEIKDFRGEEHVFRLGDNPHIRKSEQTVQIRFRVIQVGLATAEIRVTNGALREFGFNRRKQILTWRDHSSTPNHICDELYSFMKSKVISAADVWLMHELNGRVHALALESLFSLTE